jgi:hypothetical protein
MHLPYIHDVQYINLVWTLITYVIMFHFSTIYRQLLALGMDAFVQYMDYIISHNTDHHVQIT